MPNDPVFLRGGDASEDFGSRRDSSQGDFIQVIDFAAKNNMPFLTDINSHLPADVPGHQFIVTGEDFDSNAIPFEKGKRILDSLERVIRKRDKACEGQMMSSVTLNPSGFSTRR